MPKINGSDTFCISEMLEKIGFTMRQPDGKQYFLEKNHGIFYYFQKRPNNCDSNKILS